MSLPEYLDDKINAFCKKETGANQRGDLKYQDYITLTLIAEDLYAAIDQCGSGTIVKLLKLMLSEIKSNKSKELHEAVHAEHELFGIEDC